MTHDSLDLASLLEAQAKSIPNRSFLTIDGRTLTFGEFNDLANSVALGLLRRGVSSGEMVCVMLPNCLEFMLVWFGLLKIGAIEVPINTSFRGRGLAHVLSLVGTKLVIVDEEYVQAVGELSAELDKLETILIRGHHAAIPDKVLGCLDVAAIEELFGHSASNPKRNVNENDLAILLFTSGTTGASKACMLSHRFVRRSAEVMIDNLGFVSDDVLYCPYPLFHADATVFTVAPALILGARAAIGKRFSVSRFWDEIRDTGATVFDYMGATLTFLWKQAPKVDDLDHRVRLAWGVPTPDFWPEFERRFGVKLVEVYGLTDAGLVIYEIADQPHRQGSCGRMVHPYDVRIVDDKGFEVPHGIIGEFVVRTLEPKVIMDGYFGMPSETLNAFRNLWFHTGDIGYRDAEGFFYFLRRKKDAIRRRGENISAAEIEDVLIDHPEIFEAAVVGVPSEYTEEEVKACVVLRTGSLLTPKDIVAWCKPRMASFMVPRYIELLDQLPRTPTEKVEKYRLVDSGVGPGTWDSEDV